MHRNDITALRWLVDAKKSGIFKVACRDTTIEIRIKKQGNDILVRW